MIPGIVAGQASASAPFDPASYGLSAQVMWWAEDPALTFSDGDTVTTVAPYTGPDSLSKGGGTAYFRGAPTGFNGKPAFELNSTTRLFVTLTSAGYGGIVASGTNTRVRNSSTTRYQIRYAGGTGLNSSASYVPDTTTHVLAWYYNDAGNEKLWLDGTVVINAASGDSGTGMVAYQLNYDNGVYGDSDFAFACVTAGDPMADSNFSALVAGLKSHYGTP